MKTKRIICLLLTVILTMSALLLLSACGGNLNYMKADLGKYIELSEEDYKNFNLEIDFDEVTFADADRKIMNLLYQNKSKEPKYNGADVLNIPISIGDKVWLYYRGYTTDSSGREYEIDGACNFFSGNAHALDIGSLGFIFGFEESLIGKNPADYPKLELRDDGSVKDGDVIYVTYEALLPSGETDSAKSKRIDLSRADTNLIYGNGFREFFVGKSIGEKLDAATFKHEMGDAVYYDIKVEYATSCESSPLTITAHFPHNYDEHSLRGKDVYFDVYIKHTNVYDVPEYNDSFVEQTLNFTEEQLMQYEGSTLAEKHRAYLFEEAKRANEEERAALTEEALWKHLREKVKIKKLPKNDVKVVYDEYYYEVMTYYEYYSSAYSSVDAFAAQYLKITDGTNWLDYIQKQSEDVITEKLMFYYIARREKLLPEGEIYQELYEEVVSEYLEYYSDEIYKEELDKITDQAEREKRLLEIREEMLDYYGKDYFAEMVYYDYAMDDIIKLGKINP